MGFKAKKKLYLLDFQGTNLEGLEIYVRGASLGRMLDLTNLATLGQDIKSGGFSSQDLDSIKEIFSLFIEKVDRWNLEDEDGNPVPVSYEAFMDLDPGDAMQAITAWQSAILEVPAPLEQKSSGGKRWVGEPIPMEVPPANQQLLLGQNS